MLASTNLNCAKVKHLVHGGAKHGEVYEAYGGARLRRDFGFASRRVVRGEARAETTVSIAYGDRVATVLKQA